MRQWMKRIIIFVLTCASLYFGIYLFMFYTTINSQKIQNEVFNEDKWVNPLDTTGIMDKPDIYKDDDILNVECIYITLLQEKNEGEKTYTFQDLITFSEGSNNSQKNKVNVLFEDRNKGIFQNGMLVREPNASIEIRGKSSDKALQKSFKIRLFDKAGLWHNQNIINLNKHYFDSIRIRNKLSFEYFEIIPNITSLYTSFVRLYVKDLSDKEFVDYGIFTQIEQPNKQFLRNHGLNPNGHLYKAKDFKFQRYPEYVKKVNDGAFSKGSFEEVLEIKGNKDHQKLIEMLEDINDESKDINEVVETYFDKENYLTWLAVNILFDHYKTSNTNFLLYSPINSCKWYFMPWDYDDAWNFEEDRPKWQKGLSMYWDNVLHRRFFEDTNNIELLNKKIEELRTIVNENQTQAFLDNYYDIILSNITKLPDIKYLLVTLEEYKKEYELLPELTERNRLYYYELLENPMPFYLNQTEKKGDQYRVSWTSSFDAQGDQLCYDLEISRTKDFLTVIKSIKDIKGLSCDIKKLDKGIYYWRVIARDPEGNSQIPFNIWRDEFGDKYYGIECLVVE